MFVYSRRIKFNANIEMNNDLDSNTKQKKTALNKQIVTHELKTIKYKLSKKIWNQSHYFDGYLVNESHKSLR